MTVTHAHAYSHDIDSSRRSPRSPRSDTRTAADGGPAAHNPGTPEARRHPQRARSRTRAPPDGSRRLPARSSARRGLSEERKEGPHAVDLGEGARLAELARPVRGHEAPRRAQGRLWAPPGRARRPHLRRAGTQRRVSTRRLLPDEGPRRGRRTEERDQLGMEAQRWEMSGCGSTSARASAPITRPTCA